MSVELSEQQLDEFKLKFRSSEKQNNLLIVNE